MFRVVLVLRVALFVGALGAILFGTAGRLDLPFFWAYLAVLTGFGVAMLLTISPELLEERRKPAERGRDNVTLLRVGALVVFLSEWVIAGLDVGRFHWSDTVPPALQVVGLLAFAAVFANWFWAMHTNPFFSAAVRIQHDRGHYVVRSGPYRFVRHPGYAVFVLLGWGGPLALGSWWAVVPHLLVVVVFIRRAAMEDRVLREELEGYAAYAATVRYRFVPGIW